MQIEDIVTKADLAAFEKRIMAALESSGKNNAGPKDIYWRKAAEMYGVKPGKLSGLIRDGEIAHSKFGRRIFVNTDDMDAFFRKNRIMSNDEAASKAFARA